VQDTTVILERDEQRVTAGAKLTQFTEITPQNIDGFHFHGDLSDYPITAAIVDAADRKSATILQGRYLETEDPYQITAPGVVIDGLLQTVFRVKKVIDGVVLVVGVAVVLTVILVFALSLRLREREIQTMFKLGCSRVTLLKLVGAEIGIIVVLSAVLCGVALALTRQFAGDLVRGFFV
jgi:putative ABC transport system permease protein